MRLTVLWFFILQCFISRMAFGQNNTQEQLASVDNLIVKEDFKTAIDRLQKLLKKKDWPLLRAKLAQVYLQKGDCRQALPNFQTAYKHGLKNQNLEFGLALCLLKTGELKSAKKHHNAYLDKYPDDYDAKVNLAIINHKLGQTQKAIKQLQAIVDQKRHYQALLNLGLLLFESHPQSALDHFLEATRVEQNTQLDKKIGILLYRLNKYPRAEKYLLKSLFQEHKEKSEICFMLANIYFTREEFKLAEKYYLKVVQKNPSFPGVHANLGIVYYQQGKWKQALREFKMSLATDDGKTKDKGIHGKIGDLLVKLDRFQEAKTQFEMDLKKRPHSIVSLNNLAAVMQRLEKGGVQSGQPDRPKLEKRIKLLEKAYSQKPQDRQLTYNLALAYFQAGNSNKTLKLVGSRAQKPEELFLKGMSCYKLQNYSCTTDSLAKIEHDEKLGLESRLFLGLSLMELKKWQEAQKYMTAFLAQMTDDHPAHCHITHLLGKAAFHLETYSRSANYFLTAGKCSDLYYKDYFNAAVALGRLGQTAKAISVLEKNYNRDLNTGVINFWARLYLKENNQASAEKILQRGKTKDSLTYLLLGRLAFQKGAVSKAKDYFQKAKKHNQNQQLAPAISQHIKLVKEL